MKTRAVVYGFLLAATAVACWTVPRAINRTATALAEAKMKGMDCRRRPTPTTRFRWVRADSGEMVLAGE